MGNAIRQTACWLIPPSNQRLQAPAAFLFYTFYTSALSGQPYLCANLFFQYHQIHTLGQNLWHVFSNLLMNQCILAGHIRTQKTAKAWPSNDCVKYSNRGRPLKSSKTCRALDDRDTNLLFHLIQ